MIPAMSNGSRIQLALGLLVGTLGVAAFAACGGNSATANGQTATNAPAADPLAVEPTTLDMGDLVPGESVTKRVKLTNRTNKPMKVTNAVADCSCTTPTWPANPIAPGATVETDISIKPGPKQGVSLTKRVTFTLEDGSLAFLTVVGKVGLFIEQSTETLRGPSDDIAAPANETITLRGADGTPFKIDAVEPAFVTADNAETALNHTLTVNWAKWRELKKPLKITILTNHPKSPELVVSVRRTATPKPPAPTEPKSQDSPHTEE
jgi:hypothetical protein